MLTESGNGRRGSAGNARPHALNFLGGEKDWNGMSESVRSTSSASRRALYEISNIRDVARPETGWKKGKMMKKKEPVRLCDKKGNSD